MKNSTLAIIGISTATVLLTGGVLVATHALISTSDSIALTVATAQGTGFEGAFAEPALTEESPVDRTPSQSAVLPLISVAPEPCSALAR